MAACQEALRNVPRFHESHDDKIIGPLEDVSYYVGLPREYMSTDDSCAIALKIISPAQDTLATQYGVRKGAAVSITDCFKDCPPAVLGYGGRVGGDKNLLVGFRAHIGNSRVTCEGDVRGPGIIESCNTLAN